MRCNLPVQFLGATDVEELLPSHLHETADQRVHRHRLLEVEGRALKVFRQGIQDGKLKIGEGNETVVPTKFEDVPKTWLKLFSGDNTGKLVTKLEA